MYDILDFDDWEVLSIPVGGASEKDWYELNGQRGLFKFSKGGGGHFICGEYWSEKMASDIFNGLAIDCMRVDMGMIDGRLGAMCYDIVQEYGKFIQYNSIRVNSPEFYGIEDVKQLLNGKSFRRFISMLVIDFVIGNTDRHSGNFGLMMDSEMLCPIYDNGSSLCCRERPESAPLFLKDSMRMNKYTTKKLKTFVTVGNYRLNNYELLDYLHEAYLEEFKQSVSRLRLLDNSELDSILHNYSKVVDETLLEVIKRSVSFKRDYLFNNFRCSY